RNHGGCSRSCARCSAFQKSTAAYTLLFLHVNLRSLEEIFQSKLHHSSRAGGFDPAELRVRNVSVRVAEVRMIQHIRSFRAELHRLRFPDFEEPGQPRVKRPAAG